MSKELSADQVAILDELGRWAGFQIDRLTKVPYPPSGRNKAKASGRMSGYISVCNWIESRKQGLDPL